MPAPVDDPLAVAGCTPITVVIATNENRTSPAAAIRLICVPNECPEGIKRTPPTKTTVQPVAQIYQCRRPAEMGDLYSQCRNRLDIDDEMNGNDKIAILGRPCGV
jgi:hypothetical protein